MSYFFLIPISIALGLTGLGAFFWALRHDQYDDLDGAAARILMPDIGPLARSPKSDRPLEQHADCADQPSPDQTG